MLCALKCASARLCQSTSSRSLFHRSYGFPIYEHFSSLPRYFQERNYCADYKNNKEGNHNSSTSRDPELPSLSAKWTWVIRGRYKVAAFLVDNNPAIALNDRPNQYWHSHTCSNCQTVYEHTHPYKSLKHPQHIKDCPKCQKIAPADLEII